MDDVGIASDQQQDIESSRTKPRRAVRVVLVVEQDKTARLATAATLQAAGYSVLEAADGKEAIALLEGGMVPDLIVVDLLLPSTGGWDLWSFLQARPALREIAVVVWTERDVDAPAQRTCAVPKWRGPQALVASVGTVVRTPRRL